MSPPPYLARSTPLAFVKNKTDRPEGFVYGRLHITKWRLDDSCRSPTNGTVNPSAGNLPISSGEALCPADRPLPPTTGKALCRNRPARLPGGAPCSSSSRRRRSRTSGPSSELPSLCCTGCCPIQIDFCSSKLLKCLIGLGLSLNSPSVRGESRVTPSAPGAVSPRETYLLSPESWRLPGCLCG